MEEDYDCASGKGKHALKANKKWRRETVGGGGCKVEKKQRKTVDPRRMRGIPAIRDGKIEYWRSARFYAAAEEEEDEPNCEESATPNNQVFLSDYLGALMGK